MLAGVLVKANDERDAVLTSDAADAIELRTMDVQRARSRRRRKQTVAAEKKLWEYEELCALSRGGGGGRRQDIQRPFYTTHFGGGRRCALPEGDVQR